MTPSNSRINAVLPQLNIHSQTESGIVWYEVFMLLTFNSFHCIYLGKGFPQPNSCWFNISGALHFSFNQDCFIYLASNVFSVVIGDAVDEWLKATTRLWCRNSPEGREVEPGLRHPMTGILSLSTQQKLLSLLSQGRIRQRNERNGLRFSSVVPMTQSASSSHCLYGC